MDKPQPKGWRKWTTITLAQVAFGGFLVAAYGLGRLPRSNEQVDASVRTLEASVKAVGTSKSKHPRALNAGQRVLSHGQSSYSW